MTATQPPHCQAAPESGLRGLAVVVVAGAIMTILDSTIVNVALTPLGRQFHTSLPVIQWVLTGYGLALAMVIPLTGWAVERFGAKTTWIASLLIFIAGSVLSGAAWNVTTLIIFRVLQGIGGGMVMPVGQMMLARKAGPDRMARVMGVVAIPAMAGPLLGPVVGGLIMDNLSWRWMFYVNVPLCALALLLAVKLLPRDTGHSSARKIDAVGLALLSPGVALCVYGLSQAGISGSRFAISTAAGAVCVAAYVLHACRVPDPLVSVRAFRGRAFGACSAAMVIYLGAVYGLMVVLPVYFQVVRGESPLHAGLLMAPMTLGAGIVMALSGQLAHRVPARWIIIAGIALVVAGAVAFTRLTPVTSLVLVAGVLFLTSFGHGAILPTGMGAAYQDMPQAEIPSATATFNVVFRVASSIGTAVFATILQQAVRVRIPGTTSLSSASRLHGASAMSQLTSAFDVTYWWVAAAAAGAVVPAFFIPSRPAVPVTALLSTADESVSDEAADESAPENTSALATELRSREQRPAHGEAP